MKGKVKFFNEVKQFGFIIGEDGVQYFVHITGLNPNVAIKEGDAVVFEIEQGEKGPKAVKVAKE
ncbi:MAG: cold shock domain-containing protein [Nanoarchaeota archaeon]